MSVFSSAALLIPEAPLLPDWAVIACDQFSSQPEYWRAVRERTEGRPSACHLIFPEAELGEDAPARIDAINAAMRRALKAEIFRRYPESYVYVERTLLDGSVRRGIVGVVDLEAYDYNAGAESPIRATERTVVERIPPRVRIRRGAALELSHVMLLMDDAENRVLDALTERREALPLLYDFTLMQGGGRIVGRLVSGEEKARLDALIRDYEAETAERCEALGYAPLVYAVGDGNHSLAAARACWAERRAHESADSPARYAMVELQNIRDASLRFEPIHRIVTGVEPEALLRGLEAFCAPGGHEISWQAGEREGMLTLDRGRGELPVAVLQSALDELLPRLGGTIDYIHGEDALRTLARRDGAIAFLLPAIPKEDFFRGVALDGVLPRKTFSMGHAEEKRYYLEARRITC